MPHTNFVILGEVLRLATGRDLTDLISAGTLHRHRHHQHGGPDAPDDMSSNRLFIRIATALDSEHTPTLFGTD